MLPQQAPLLDWTFMPIRSPWQPPRMGGVARFGEIVCSENLRL